MMPCLGWTPGVRGVKRFLPNHREFFEEAEKEEEVEEKENFWLKKFQQFFIFQDLKKRGEVMGNRG